MNLSVREICAYNLQVKNDDIINTLTIYLTEFFVLE